MKKLPPELVEVNIICVGLIVTDAVRSLYYLSSIIAFIVLQMRKMFKFGLKIKYKKLWEWIEAVNRINSI